MTTATDTTASTAAPAATEAPPLRTQLEALLLVVDEPAPVAVLATALERPTAEVEQTLAELSTTWEAEGRGFRLRQVAGGWRLYTAAECAEVVERFVLQGQTARLSQAALETLAVVAYAQPVTRAKVASIRGVNSDGVLRTLVTRRMIQEAGVEPGSPATLFVTTPLFLEKLGINELSELPPLAPLLPDLEAVLGSDAPEDARWAGVLAGTTGRTAQPAAEATTADEPPATDAIEGQGTDDE
jgi:segregation and condensation protein B